MKNLNLCWAGHRASDAMSFLDQLNVSLIVSCDYGQTGAALERDRRIPVFSHERRQGYRRSLSIPKINSAFEELTVLSEFLHAARRLEPLAILPYANRPALAQVAAEEKWRVLAPSPDLRDYFSDKRRAREIFQSLNVPLVDCRQMMFRDLEAEVRRGGLRSPRVVKHPFSESGSGIYLVTGPDDLDQISEEAKAGAIDLLVEPFLDCYSINVNGVATPYGSILAPVSLQIIGADCCATGRFKFCGNDFASAALIPDRVKQKCYDIADRLGALMASRGYLGLFGVDFVADSSGVYPVEINARFQNSTSLIDSLMAEAGIPTLGELHALTFLGEELELRRRVGLLCDPPAGSQIIVYNRREHPFVRLTGATTEGIYRWDDKARRLQFLRDAISINEAKGDEILIGGSLPQTGFRVEREAALCRIQGRRRFLGDDLRQLTPSIADCALALEKELAMEAAI
jgi:D-alanine-D-alanine ligase-like ATP-grasp enzyme